MIITAYDLYEWKGDWQLTERWPQGGRWKGDIGTLMTIAENIARIRANMDAAAREAGRDPKEILLVGASR